VVPSTRTRRVACSMTARTYWRCPFKVTVLMKSQASRASACERPARVRPRPLHRRRRRAERRAVGRDLREVLAERGHHSADVIVSGLPWAAFAASLQHDLLDTLTGALAPHGAFTTFAYAHTRRAPPARRLRQSLGGWFEEVVVSRTVWANMPPAFVYFCRRPRVPALVQGRSRCAMARPYARLERIVGRRPSTSSMSSR
jgi:hypothetical protein